jgi:hypothetical protein
VRASIMKGSPFWTARRAFPASAPGCVKFVSIEGLRRLALES